MKRRMRRRSLLTGLAAAGVAALPPVALARTPLATLRVGATSPQPLIRSFLHGFAVRMRDLGYVEGQNFTMDYIDLQGRPEPLC
jgi:hypothetical protein